ncbi:MAG: HAMP domain-containing histidine kinase [Planctomycetes bacterium]|nr:HAMP domain-containing histidine kinase [Planctomycetota bacterium]
MVDDRVIEISMIAGGLAHEIRNPLSTLLLNLQLLEEDLSGELGGTPDTLRRARKRIATTRGEAERLQRMLDEFLLLVKPVLLKRTVADLNGVVRRLVEFYEPQAREAGVGLVVYEYSEPLLTSIDPSVIHQALLNLLINACHATPEGGEISIHLSVEESGSDSAWARLEIGDNGEGMSEDVLSKAMHAFYSTKPSGSGLGLSTTSRIVAAHGGTIDVKSEANVGTTFLIRLPLATRVAG